MVSCQQGRLYSRKGTGLVRDLFRSEDMAQLPGNIGIGHVRYPTAGGHSSDEAQPFYVNSPYGIAFSHNGNLVNSEQLKEQLFKSELRHINTGSDSEILLNVFAHALQGQVQQQPFSIDRVFDAVSAVCEHCRGGYAVVALIVGRGLLAFRDPWGIRPLIHGCREQGEHMIASESVALSAQGFDVVADLQPGEAIFIDLEGNLQRRLCVTQAKLAPCLFEFVYLARPDSVMDGVSVYQARLRMGESLGKQIQQHWPNHDIDVVVPVPDTSRTAALELANCIGVRYREGFIKNRYIGRTFIMPEQHLRAQSVRRKLHPIAQEMKGRNVMLVDDSIVRGTTSSQIIQMAREAGARKVYMASAAPPVRYPNVYGIDMPSVDELVAQQRNVEQICQAIGADRLIFQSFGDLTKAVLALNPRFDDLEGSCFNGRYITGDVNPEFLRHNAAYRKVGGG